MGQKILIIFKYFYILDVCNFTIPLTTNVKNFRLFGDRTSHNPSVLHL